MAEKPRVKAPKQRASTSHDPGRNRRLLGIGAAAGGGLLGVVAVVALLGLGGGGTPSEDDVRASLAAAGCTLQAVEAEPGQHSLGADEEGDWNTDPPTNGPHFGFDQAGNLGTVIWGAYDQPVQLARIVHNLEHGGVYILYGDDVTDDVVQQLRGFYDTRQRGTVLALYPKLGDEIALGAWVAEGEEGNGYLAKCTTFDEEAFSSFFDGFQFKGPERFPESALLPGGN